jgi:hypothetical protein
VTDFGGFPESLVTMLESSVTMPEWRCTAQEWCYAYEQLSGYASSFFVWRQRARTKDQYA